MKAFDQGTRKAIAAIILVVLILGGTIFSFILLGVASPNSNKMQVVASFYPLYYFSSQIGGDRVDVHTLIPDNVEPHSFEPTPVDLIMVSKAKILVYNGEGFEPWINSFISAVDNPSLIQVDTSKNLDPLYVQGAVDPHFWIDPLTAKSQVNNILSAFMTADPANATYYQENAANLNSRLDALNNDFVTGLANRTKNAIITTHEGFNYMAARYQFEAYGAIGISGDQQPTPQDMIRLANLVDQLQLHYVFSEPVFSDAVIETISMETGTQVLILDGAHGRSGVHAEMDYFEIMRANLQNLIIGLEVTS
jgi:zinc transport system substrate-binding protein